MALPGAVSPGRVTDLPSAQRAVDAHTDAVNQLLRAVGKVTAANATGLNAPDVFVAVPSPTVGMITVHGGHLYVCVTAGTWTQVI